MRLEHAHLTERFGAVRIHELQRVIELDSGAGHVDELVDHAWTSQLVSTDAISTVERDLVVVVPCMNETRRVIEGVLSGVPHDCLIVLVSNSSRTPVDRYQIELQTVEQFCGLAGRPALTIHQRDPGLAAAFKAAGMPELTDEGGLIRTGKGEAMLVGLALAALTGRRYLGFIDSDNYVPGAVNEYCKAFAAGLHLADSPYAMVRISWHSKPKMRDGRLFFSRRGRASEVTNHFLNRLIAEYSSFGTDVVTTGNAGEHALTMELGLRMRLAGGFAVEPFEFVDLFEQFGGVVDSLHPEVMASSVSIRQIETRNPHFHEDKGDLHVRDMRLQALNVLYHSSVCLPAVREDIVEFMVAQGALAPGGVPPRERVYPPLSTLALDRMLDVLVAEADTFHQIERRFPAGIQLEPPIIRATPVVPATPIPPPVVPVPLGWPVGGPEPVNGRPEPAT
jgi:mannosyl-3-phosphoglycerate synthase